MTARGASTPLQLLSNIYSKAGVFVHRHMGGCWHSVARVSAQKQLSLIHHWTKHSAQASAQWQRLLLHHLWLQHWLVDFQQPTKLFKVLL